MILHFLRRWLLVSALIACATGVSRVEAQINSAPIITVQPTNVLVFEGGTATFSIQLAWSIGAAYQWHRNGTNIPGAISQDYSISSVALVDNTNRFQCFVTNVYGNTNSIEAILTVVPDKIRPVISSVPGGFIPARTNSEMRFVSLTGKVGNPSRLLLYLGEIGEVYIDDLFLANGSLAEAGTNLIVNGDFETPLLGAPAITNFFTTVGLYHTNSVISQTNAHSGANSLRIVSTNNSSFALNRILYKDIPGVTNGQLCTLSFWYRPTFNCTNLFARFQSSTIGSSSVPAAILTPTITPATNISPVANLGDDQSITIYFSEPVDSATASVAANYSVNNGVTVSAVTLGDDGLSVVLSTSPLQFLTTYVLTVNNVRDRAVVPNTILPNSQINFTLDFTPLDMGILTGPIEPIGASSRRGPLVISEIMYHPSDRPDGRNLEFIEIYNSQEWFEDISGFRISGSIDYTFAKNTLLPAHGYLLLAAVPADIQAVHGLSGALPYVGALPNGSGTLRIRNRQDAVLWEITYGSTTPWPVSADGAGHSLVLARPSFGEGDARAWAASALAGGSPRTNETASANPYRTVVINEFLAHTDDPQLDHIELYNYSTQAVNLAGCVLTDDANTNKFTLPPGTIIPARGFVVYDQNQLGFSLSSAGETIFFKNTNGTRIIDAVRFEGQANGVSSGRYPDGAPGIYELQSKTPGSNNTRRLLRDIVLNEIMHSPVSGDSADEFVELFNRGSNAVNLSKWIMRGGISYTFPSNAVIAANGYVVVANSAARLMSNYPGLNAANTFGDYGGKLGGSERVTLTMPDDAVSTNQSGGLVTNKIQIVVDEVSYASGGRWGPYADDGGSSLELIDPRNDHRLAPNWAASDETAKNGWVTVEHTGTIDHGQGVADALHIIAIGAGEWLVDDVEVFRISAPGVNLISNPNFNAGLTGWVPQGVMVQTSADATGGTGNSGCLHVRASRSGNTGNRIRTALTSALNGNEVVTIRAKVRWLKGSPEILFRLKGSWLEAPGAVLTAKNLGTPGASNSVARVNAGAAITDVRHHPPLPAVGQNVTVTARVQDHDGLSALVLKYRIDPATNYTIVAMNYNGAGFYSAVIPGQAANTIAAFFIEAQDNFSPRALTRFPNAAPQRECLVRFGDPALPGNNFGTYRFWMTQATINKWSAREQLSNDSLDITFIYGSNRVIYNSGGVYSGSPYHQGYNSPVGNECDYVLSFPKDDALLDETEVTLSRPGNGGGDGTLAREQTAYWIANQLGLPLCYRRTVNVIANGVRRGAAMEDVQQPGSDMAKEWYPDDPDGETYKIQIWFEFDDAMSGFSGVGCNLGNYTTTGGTKKLARYRWNWAKRGFNGSSTNYTSLYGLVDSVNNSLSGAAYTSIVESSVDVDQWFRTFVVEHIVGNNDSYAYGGGQNMYSYKPVNGPWKLYIWDIDFAFASGGATSEMFSPGGRSYAPDMDHPPFRRLYYQAMIDAVNGPLLAAKSTPLLDARHAGFVASGLNAEGPAGTKDYIAQRRDYILTLISNVAAPFSISGGSFSTNKNLVTLSGSAPVGVRTIRINGIEALVTWTALTTWTANVVLPGGTNSINVQGYNPHGVLLATATNTFKVNVTLPPALPKDFIVINEIMFNPAVAGGEYVEIYNTSTNSYFDLSFWQLSGANYTFPNGSFIAPRGFIVLAKNRATFTAAYGAGISVFDEFSGSLQSNGETLSLIKPGATPAQDVVIDRVRYETVAPWPVGANGTGSSIQLIDPKQDHSRPGNWSGNYIAGGFFPASTNSNPRFVSLTGVMGTTSRLLLYLGEIGDVYLDDLFLANGSFAETGTNYIVNGSFEYPLSGSPSLTNFFTSVGTYHANSVIAVTNAHSGSNSLRIVSTNNSSFALARILYKDIPGPTNGQACTFSFWYRPTFNCTNLFARFQSSTIGSSATPAAVVNPVITLATNVPSMAFRTPGATNSMAATLPAFPPLWINEVQPDNITGIFDNAGLRDPWIELHNSGTNVIILNNHFLANNYATLNQWAFPNGTEINPGEFKIIFADAQTGQSTPAELHTSFRLTNTTGSVALSRLVNGQMQVVDYLNYGGIGSGRSYGDYPDGQSTNRQEFYVVTPGATNNSVSPPLVVFINEWMADNLTTLADPADGDYEDWFEIYNPGTNTVNLSGFYLTDTFTNKFQSLIPAGYTIPPGGHLLVWADNETTQNSPSRVDLHVNFKLSASGEAIGLFAADGTQIDAVTFGAQTADVSQGRFPDGTGPVYAMTNTTPRAANLSPFPNAPPALAVISNKFVHAGQTIFFNAAATDSDLPAQTLTFSLDVAPAGAGIEPATGLYFWTPTAAQTPGTNAVTIRVTDNGLPALFATRTFSITVVAAPGVTAVNRFGDDLVLTLQTYPGRTYRLEFKDDLSAGSWTPLGGNITAGGESLSITNDLSAAQQRFYRAVVVE